MNKFHVLYSLLILLTGAPCLYSVQVFVFTERNYVINVNLDDSVHSLREAIKKKLGTSGDNFFLIANGSVMREGNFLSDFLIKEHSTIFLIFTQNNAYERKVTSLNISGGGP
jgi:hypothetical protein